MKTDEEAVEKLLETIIEITEVNENCLQEMHRNMIEFNQKVFELLMKES